MKVMQTTFAMAASLAALSASAHHSPAVLYNLDRQIEIEGVVTRFTLGNPHARIYLIVRNGSSDQEWLAEGGSRTVLLRRGWTGDEVTPGESVRIVGNPSRDGSNVVHWLTVQLADGRQLWGEDLDLPALEALRQRQRR